MIVDGVDDDIGSGVAGPQQPGILDRLVIGFTLENNQFRRVFAHVDIRHAICQGRGGFGRAAVQQVGLSAFRQLLGDRIEPRRRGAGPAPGPFQ